MSITSIFIIVSFNCNLFHICPHQHSIIFVCIYWIKFCLFACVWYALCWKVSALAIRLSPLETIICTQNSPLKTSYRITHTHPNAHKLSKQIERLESNRCKETLHSLREMQSLEMMINFCIVSICVSVHWELLFDKMSYDKSNEMRRNRTKNAKVSNKTLCRKPSVGHYNIHYIWLVRRN